MLTFTVPGPPIGKQRARVTRHGAFTPKATKAFEASVAAYARAAGVTPYDGRVAIMVVAHMPDRRRRDVDNVIKSVTDALNGIAYEDDTQVHVVIAVKAYDKADPRTVVSLHNIKKTLWERVRLAAADAFERIVEAV